MGELPPGSSVLPHQRSLQGPAGRTHAHQTAGGALRRDAGKALICTRPLPAHLVPSTPLEERPLLESSGFPWLARVSPWSSSRFQFSCQGSGWLTGVSDFFPELLAPSDHSHPFRLIPEAMQSFAFLTGVWASGAGIHGPRYISCWRNLHST